MILNTSVFEEALNIVEKAVPIKPLVPVLNSILMSVGEETTLTANNGAYSITVKVDHSGGDVAGKWLLPPKIVDIIRSAPSPEVEMKFGDRLLISAGGANYKLNFDSAVDDYPLEFGDTIISNFDIDISRLGDILFAVSTEESRPAFHGVLCDNGKAIASDTYRLAIVNIDWPEGSRVLIPSSFLKIASRLGQVSCEVGEGWLRFSTETTSMSCRLLRDSFPNILGILPSEYVTEILINTQEIKGALQRASLLVEGKNKAVKMEIGDQLTMSSNSEQGLFTESLNYLGEEREFFFNARFMLDALAGAPDEFSLKLASGEESPVVLEWEDLYYLMLPIKRGVAF